MKKIGKLLLGILLLIVVGIGYSFYQMQQRMQTMNLVGVDLQTIPDGTYQGSCDTFLVVAEVEVSIFNHKIQSIDLLKHQNGMGEKGESILDTMVQRNTTDVDVVSSATVSSTTIRCAVENALVTSPTTYAKCIEVGASCSIRLQS